MTTEELNKRASQLIKQFDKMQIKGAGWSGNARDGFQFRGVPEPLDSGGAKGPPIIPPPTTGACCFYNGTCANLTETACSEAAGSGWFNGVGTNCGEVDCHGACCHVGGSCSMESWQDCDLAGGTFYGDPSCDPNPCAPGVGACCIPWWTPHCGAPTNGTDCVNAGGFFQGNGTTCCPATCYCPTHPTDNQVQVVLSGIVTCGCTRSGPCDSSKMVGDLNGAYTLTRTAGPCTNPVQYEYMSPSPVVNYYCYGTFDTSCAGSSSMTPLYLNIIFQCGNGSSNLCIILLSSPSGGGGFGLGCVNKPVPLYSGTVFDHFFGDCGPGPTFSNFFGGGVGSQGIVTYTPPEF